jgi:hypothetical protein
MTVLDALTRELQSVQEQQWASARQLEYEKFKLDNPNLRYKDFDLISAFIDPPPPKLVSSAGPSFPPAVSSVEGPDDHHARESSSAPPQITILRRPQAERNPNEER